MKSVNNKLSFALIAVSLICSAYSSVAIASEEVKNWTGTVREDRGYHTPDHDWDHDLVFVRQSDNETFDIVDSPSLLKLHGDKDKNLVIEADGELTSRFLFWGGNLIVKNFKVLELQDIAHREAPTPKHMSRISSGGGLDRR